MKLTNPVKKTSFCLPKVYHKLLVLLLIILILLYTIEYDGRNTRNVELDFKGNYFKRKVYGYKKNEETPFQINTTGCKIPELETQFIPITNYPLHKCNQQFATLENGILRLMDNLDCFYQVIERGKIDDSFILSEMRNLQNETIIDAKYLQVTCKDSKNKKYIDYFVNSKLTHLRNSSKRQSVPKPNVLILGIDSVARQHFHAYMKKTKKTLNELNFVEYYGYNKVGENTLPNMMALLTGRNDSCDFKVDLDSCKFLWKELSSDYETGLLEDAPNLATFNYKKYGFHTQPTSIYIRPLMLKANSFYPHEPIFPCVGSRNTAVFILDTLLDFARVKVKPFFVHTWITGLAHENLERLGSSDILFHNFFHALHNESILDNTIVIFLSDHGYRYGPTRKSFNGYFNEKLPFLFIRIPDKFFNTKESKRFQLNSRKLTTPYDLHETLRELLENGQGLEKLKAKRTDFGISFLKEIPGERTCEDAGISDIFCSCTPLTHLTPSEKKLMKRAGERAVESINANLPGKCKKFILSKVIGSAKKSRDEFVIGFEVKPGLYEFEATVRLTSEGDFKVGEKILRISPILRRRTYCTTDFFLELFCYCDLFGFLTLWH